MTHSYKKNSIISVTTLGGNAGIQKKWKNACNNKLRNNVSDEIPSGSNYKRISGDIWNSPSDGKRKLDATNKQNYRK